MTTHIFLALGMWDEVVSQNVIASGPDRSRWRPGLYTQWLHYGLLQLGLVAEAVSLRRATLANAGTPLEGGRASYALEMRAAQAVNGRQWRDPDLSAPLAVLRPSVGAEAADAFAQGYAALQRGEPAIASVQRARLSDLQARVAARPDATLPGTVDALTKALDAAIALQAGRRDEAIALVTDANRIEDALPVEFGPPTIVKPTWELRGDMLPDRQTVSSTGLPQRRVGNEVMAGISLRDTMDLGRGVEQ